MRPQPLLRLALLLLLPLAAQAYEGEEYPEMHQEAPMEETYPQDAYPQEIPQDSYPEETYPDQSYPDPSQQPYPDDPYGGQSPDQIMPMEEPMVEPPDYTPEQSPEFQQHLMELRRSCEESANEAELLVEEREQFIQDCLQSQGVQ